MNNLRDNFHWFFSETENIAVSIKDVILNFYNNSPPDVRWIIIVLSIGSLLAIIKIVSDEYNSLERKNNDESSWNNFTTALTGIFLRSWINFSESIIKGIFSSLSFLIVIYIFTQINHIYLSDKSYSFMFNKPLNTISSSHYF